MLIGILCVSGVVCLWSITSIFIKIALRFVDPGTLTFLRLLQGLVVFLALFAMKHGQWRRLVRYDRWLLIGGLGLTVNYICFVLALEFTGAGTGGLVVQIQFVVLAILAAVVLKERLGWIKISGIVLVICGVLVVFGLTGALGDVLSARYALGNSIMLAAGIGWGIYALSNKVLSARMSNLEILIPLFTLALIGSAVVGARYVEIKAPITVQAVLVIAVLGFGSTGAGFLLMSEALRRLSGTLVGTMTAITPLFTLVLAGVIIDEVLNPWMFLSALLIVSGVLSIGYSEWRERSQRTRR